MHDIKFIRENPTQFDAQLARRGLPPVSDEILELDKKRRGLQTDAQQLLEQRNAVSKEIGAAKAAKDEAKAATLMATVNALKEKLPALEAEERAIASELDAILSSLPNLPAADTPEGKDEHDNVEILKNGTPRVFNFTPQPHETLGEKLGLLSAETAAKLSGSRFVVLRGALAKLERVLAQFMLNTLTEEFGYEEVSPPLLVRDNALYGTGQLPKFGEDLFKTTTDLWLIPTAEVSLTNLVREEILNPATLPLRFTAHTPCFRSEAGSAGRDTTGILRQHQFYKVEMVSITTPEQSVAEHERMTQCAETILQRLGLPYRKVLLCTGDMGFCAVKTYDLEVWVPSQNTYREISSCSNCGDFQARRMNTRFKDTDGKNQSAFSPPFIGMSGAEGYAEQTQAYSSVRADCEVNPDNANRPRKAGNKGALQFVHTLNGSALAVGRTLLAIMENYQQADGSITIPAVLRGAMGCDSIQP